jgi:flagellar basal-body rod protein FlgC
MVNALSIAISGLLAQGQRMAVSANNIANASTTGSLPTAETPTSTVYKPLDVSYAALTINGTGSGVAATVTENLQGYSPVYDPTNIYANKDGVIAAPNVDLIQENINILESKTVFKANLSVIKAQDQMLGDLLDTIS